MTPFPGAVLEILEGYYNRGRARGSMVHCTAKFMGNRGSAVGAKAYHARPLVQSSIGKVFKLQISSLSLTPRTMGARVTLDETQVGLFDKPEEKDWNGRQPKDDRSKGDQPILNKGNTSRSPTPEKKPKGKGSKKNKKGSNKHEKGDEGEDSGSDARASWDGIVQYSMKNPRPTKPVAKQVGRAAHITLGIGRGFEARDTNFDILRLCDIEVSQPGREEDYVSVTGGRARYFGDGVCCVYFDPPLKVSSIFSGVY